MDWKMISRCEEISIQMIWDLFWSGSRNPIGQCNHLVEIIIIQNIPLFSSPSGLPKEFSFDIGKKLLPRVENTNKTSPIALVTQFTYQMKPLSNFPNPIYP